MVDQQADTYRKVSKSQLSSLLKAAGDDLRLDILRALKTDSLGVLELCHVFDTKQSGMSHHLKVLARAALVTTRREGNSIFYRRDNTKLENNLQATKDGIFLSVDDLELEPNAQDRLAMIYRQRAQASQLFFAEQASKFRQQQDLIAEFGVYGPQVAETISAARLASTSRAAEVGPGIGELLPFLCEKFNHVVALDNSKSMLEKAALHADNHTLKNVELVLGDTSYLAKHADTFDCVVMNMVLHHTPSPQKLFSDISCSLKLGGVLAVCDLCMHEQEWTKEACGDIWMGFEPKDLTRWAQDNSLVESGDTYIALRNGFQIQIRLFSKH